MDISKQNTSSYQEFKQFLSHSYTSNKKEFVSKYRKLYYGRIEAKELYLQILTELKRTISVGNVDSFKKLTSIICYISSIESQATIRTYYDNTNTSNPFENTNLVILTCKHNKDEILKYIYDNSEILNNLSINIKKDVISPKDEDGTCHNAFYYAIRSGNVQLLDTLINKWPGNYFNIHLEELDEILSKAYEELKIKNVPLSDQIEIFVEKKLIDLRFFSNSSEQVQNIKSSLNKIKQRIELVLVNISLLNSAKEVDETFLYRAKFVAQNIEILKRQLKSTYDRLPWEEIEFCLVSFISSQIKQQEINLFYHATLNKDKIIKHLNNFATKLDQEKENLDISKLANLPKLKREKIIPEIVDNYPQFEELYNDYQQIRDIYSLEKMRNYITLALSADSKEKDEQLMITRTLQVMGECLKNTLESPKLSNTTIDFLLLSLPRNTRKFIIDLRNSLSHAYSLFKRIEIEEKPKDDFFIHIQNDIKKIHSVINDVLYTYKIKTIRLLLKKLINAESVDEIKEISGVFNNVKFDKTSSVNFTLMEHEKLEKLIEELSKSVTEKTSYEEELFNNIGNKIRFEKTKLTNNTFQYIKEFASLKNLTIDKNDNTNDNIIKGIKIRATCILQDMTAKIEPDCLKQIAELSIEIFHSIKSRIQHDNVDKIQRIICEIFFIAEIEIDNIMRIEELRDKLNEKGYFIPKHKHKNSDSATEEKYKNQLTLKLSDLKNILNTNGLNNQLNEKFSSYKIDKKLQAAVEMLVLDIMSILDQSKDYLTNTFHFIDDNAPLLIGKCLRNHLAHGSSLLDVLLFDPRKAIILNAKKLTAEDIIKNKKKIGKSIIDNPTKLEQKYRQGLETITNQTKMFVDLEEGNLEDLKSCLKTGADIHARSINFWTTLHFAAKGPSLEVIKFLLDKNLSTNAKDIHGQSPLHIAAAYGRSNIVEFFIEEAGLCVGTVDNNGETPLHIASQNGHKDTVMVLLKNKANTITKNYGGLAPLHYAVRNNKIDIVKVLVEKDANVDINETLGGYTALHEAAENGYLEIVNFLLENKANVNAKTDKDWTPLHAAALRGHLEVVNALILKGAEVNARVIDGCTPLHYAVEMGEENVVDVLLKHCANVNVSDKTSKVTPLHYAARDGHVGIVKSLLKKKANSSAAAVEGLTPLHVAAENGHLEIVSALLKDGVDINAENKIATPLHCAVQKGQTKMVDFLIKNKAQINVKTENNLTPLHVAALRGHKDIIDLLIKNKAKINIRTSNGDTPLHLAVANGNQDIIDVLIKNKAEVNSQTNIGVTPLQIAAINGYTDIVVYLIENKAEVSSKAGCGFTPLDAAISKGQTGVVNLLIKYYAQLNATNSTFLELAVETNNKDIIKILIENGANINAKNKSDLTPLSSAVKRNRKEIVEVLIAKGANVNADDGQPLKFAVLYGYKDIVEILLKNKSINLKCTESENTTLLHIAARTGHKGIVNALIKTGADVNAINIDNVTPLYIAAKAGHEEIVEILMSKGANINIENIEGPLHIAAANGHNNIVEVLLHNGADINIKDNKNRTSAELAVAHDHLQVVRTLLRDKKVDVHAKGNDGWTMLHIAAQAGNLEIITCLVDHGANINAKNSSGSKPIHIAARDGYKNIVEFFLTKGLSINDLGAAFDTLLHYAAIKGQIEVAKYLIEKGIDVNTINIRGETPIHIAASCDSKDIIEVLIKNGAMFNIVDFLNRKPLDIANDKDIINLLTSTGKLFEAVKHNSSSEVKKYIKAKAFVNAKNSDNATPLHYAAWKGYDEVVDILLQNKGNPNAVGNKGFTPLHYAAKFSHLKIVKALLSNGAIYDAVSDTDKIPVDLAVDKSIVSLFKLVSESFKNVKNGNSKVIYDLEKVRDIDTVKAVMNACNRENRTLIVTAIHNDFPKVKQLKQILQDDVTNYIYMATVLFNQENHQEALNIYNRVLEKRREILGPNNPGTLDIQNNIAVILYKQQNYQEALIMFQEIYQKQTEQLGIYSIDTLKTRSSIALVLHRQGKNEEALNIYKEVFTKQKEILGMSHTEVLITQGHMALVLNGLKKYEEALSVNYDLFEKHKEKYGISHPTTLTTQKNIAMVLSNQCKYDESLKMYQTVYDIRKKIIGPCHSDTLRTLHDMAVVLFKQKKDDEALKAYKLIFDTQKTILGPNHHDTLNTQYNIANLLFTQGKFVGALKNYLESFEQRRAILGPTHPEILVTQCRIQQIHIKFDFDGSNVSDILHHLQKDINIAASNGDLLTVKRLLKEGADANDKDVDGRTPIHYAISNSQVDIINILLRNGADVTQTTNKGNTSLHTATSKGYKEIAEILLQHITHNRLNEFINAQTTVEGTTSLHVAAKNGFLAIVKLLMKYGAKYNIENKEHQTPLDLSKDENIINLFKLTEELFEDAENGNTEVIDKLRSINPIELVAVTNTRNNQEKTLLQVAIINKHKYIASSLSEMLKSLEQE